MDSNPFNPPAEAELSYGQLFNIVVRRGFWFVGTLAGALAIATLMTLSAEPEYRSQMQLLVEPNYEQGVRLNEGPPNSREAEIDLATQLNLMRSRQFIEQTVEILRDKYPDLDVDKVHESLSLSQITEDDVETKIFQAVYIDNDPQRTKDILDTLQSVYQEYNLKQSEFRLQRGLQSLNEQLTVVQNNLIESQSSLKSFRQQQNLINPEQQAEAVVTTLNEIVQQQAIVQGEYSEALSRYEILQQQLGLNPQNALIASRLSQSSRYQLLLNQLQQTELALAQRRSTFLDADPSVQLLLAQRQNQLGLLQQEIQRVLGQSLPQVRASGEQLLTTGQLGAIDQQLVNQLVEVQATLRGLQARQQTLRQVEQDLRAQVNRFPQLIAEFDRLQPQADIEQGVLEQLLQERQQLRAELARGGFNWQLVEAAQPGEQISPSPARNLALGIVVGLFLGGIVAFAREGMDKVIRTPEAVRRQGNVPLLGVLPAVEELRPVSVLFKRSVQSQPLIQKVQSSLVRESLDLIYKNIQMFTGSSPLRSLLITSALPGEGKSMMALGLATSAARSHQRVLLVDANLRQPTLHHELAIPNEYGLSMLLQQPDAIPNPTPLSLPDCQIDVLTAGTRPSDPVRLLNSLRMRELLARFESAYDLVIVDSSPVLGIVDALQVASVCSGCVVISRLNQITQDALLQTVAMLSSLNLIGIVASEVHMSVSSHPTPDNVFTLLSDPGSQRNGTRPDA